MAAHRRADVGFERLGVAADVPCASGAYIRMGLVGFLDDRAGKAGEIWQLARQDRFAKLDVCNEATERDVTAARSVSNKRA